MLTHDDTRSEAEAAALPFVSVRGLSKTFGGAQALKGVSIDIAPGEVHGLVGANGAGKSTLIRILAGLVVPDAGEIRIDGRPVLLTGPSAATELGMNFIHQELAFVPGMTVLENITLGIPKPTRFGMVDWKATERQIAPIADRVGITAPLSANVSGLSTAENWLVNICRALVRKARLIVMDEPTASLSAGEVEKLFTIVEDLSASGVAVLYVSHRLDEILRLCNRVTVFRDGRSVAGFERADLAHGRLVEAIVGGKVDRLESRHEQAEAMDVVLSVRGVASLPMVHDVSLDLHRGEVLGIGGLVGAGRSELARLIFGAERLDAGSMTLDGHPYAPRSPSAAVEAGVGLVPEERRTEALILTKSVAFNALLANLDKAVKSPLLPLIDGQKRKTHAEAIVRDLAIKTDSIDKAVGKLSGGNQQKVVIGRWLLKKPRVLILDEPTRGVDIGARAEIHRLIRKLADDGMAVIVISSDPDELPDLSDRVLVMAEGRVVRELRGEGISRAAIIEASYQAKDHSGKR